MTDGRKIVGLCLTGMQEPLHADFLYHLHHHMTRHGMKLIVLNSFVGPDGERGERRGAASIYRLLNYELLDALILLGESLEHSGVLDELITCAREHEVPVLLLNSEREGVSCLNRSFEDGYRGIIRHVVREHGARSIRYLGGNGESDPRESRRLAVLKETLKDEGIELGAGSIFHAGYRKETILDYALSFRNTAELPHAIFCVNDNTALDLCDSLAEASFSVPGDIRVIGFDGLRVSELQYSAPDDLPRG